MFFETVNLTISKGRKFWLFRWIDSLNARRQFFGRLVGCFPPAGLRPPPLRGFGRLFESRGVNNYEKDNMDEAKEWDWGSIIIGALVGALFVASSRNVLSRIELTVLALLFVGPALAAWSATWVISSVGNIPSIPSLTLWVLCLAGSTLFIQIENIVALVLPSSGLSYPLLGFVAIGLLGRVCVLAGCGVFIIGATMVPMIWWLDRSNSPSRYLLAFAKLGFFLAVILILAGVATEYILRT